MRPRFPKKLKSQMENSLLPSALTQNPATFVTLGLFTGVVAGIFGVGGGVVLVPLLVFLLGFSQLQANATSLVALLLPVGMLGVLEYYRSGRLQSGDIRYGLWVGLGIFLGAWVGAKIAMRLPDFYLKRGFSLLLIFVAYRLWMAAKK
jgi:uncharacterized membrane protein YfcA